MARHTCALVAGWYVIEVINGNQAADVVTHSEDGKLHTGGQACQAGCSWTHCDL